MPGRSTLRLAWLLLFVSTPPAVAAGEKIPRPTAAVADTTRIPVVTIDIPDSLTLITPEGGNLLAPTMEVRARRIDPSELISETVTSLGRTDIERFQPMSVADALVTVPGVDLNKTSTWSARPSLRGLGGNRVLLKIDGVRVNPVRGHGPDPSIAALDQVESIEVQAGASAAQDGTDALGGVINIVTRRPLIGDTAGTSVQLHSRAATPGGSRAVGGRIQHSGPVLGWEFSGNMGRQDGLNTPDGDIPDSGFRDESLSGRVVALTGAFQSEVQVSRYSAYDVGLPAFASGSGNGGVYPLRRRDALRAESAYRGDGWLREAKFIADLQEQRADFTETVVDSTFLRDNFVARTVSVGAERVTTRDYGILPELRFQLWQGVELYGEARRQESDGPREDVAEVYNRNGDQTSREVTSVPSMPASSRTLFAAGANVSRYLGRNRLNLGVRFDQVRAEADAVGERDLAAADRTDSKLSGSFGVTRTVGPARLYARTATGFRVPTLDERYYNGFIHGGLYLFGNADLSPETSWSNEVGARFRSLWGGRIEFARISFYRNDVRDLISFRYIDQLFLVPRFQYVNIENAVLWGVETSTHLNWRGWGLTFNGSLPTGEDEETGKRISTVGPARVSFDLVWPVGKLVSGLEMTTRARWSDGVKGVDGDFERPAFWAADLELSAPVSDFRISFTIRNLLNHAYSQPLSSIPEAGRTFGLALHYETDLPFGATDVNEETP